MINRIIIISDASCLIALDNINELTLLSKLFTTISITKEVKEEFGKALPEWIKIQIVKDENRKTELKKLVDEGEASAIALALETENALLIIDEKKGRKLARSLDIKIAGTLQILLSSKIKGHITSLSDLLSRLENNGFWISKTLRIEVLRKADEL